MANEITHNYTSGLALYFCCFQQDGDVFLTGGASDEVWGTGGRTADDYDEAVTEEATSGHYKGSMAAGVGAGVYQVQVRLRAGASPANSDIAIGQGEIYWTGSAEKNISTLDAHLTDIKGTGFIKDTDSMVDLAHTGADGDTLETLSDQLDGIQTDVDTIVANTGKVVNVYPTGEQRVITGGATVGIEDPKD